MLNEYGFNNFLHLGRVYYLYEEGRYMRYFTKNGFVHYRYDDQPFIDTESGFTSRSLYAFYQQNVDKFTFTLEHSRRYIC